VALDRLLISGRKGRLIRRTSSTVSRGRILGQEARASRFEDAVRHGLFRDAKRVPDSAMLDRADPAALIHPRPIRVLCQGEANQDATAWVADPPGEEDLRQP
jgi:hypothetical protein